ncbi:MAG: CGGC domain-containing protein [Candidatus Latescibacteria bacterium]|nr:CGGC domain-containing protein [Candidatus Latescibacterota bacterium]
MEDKDYIAVVQCHIVKQRCSGYLCEQAFNERTGGFEDYPRDKEYRTLHMTYGGCCGRALHRKLGNLVSKIKKYENIDKDRIVVQLSSCITKDYYHGPPCPHLDYLKTLIGKLGLDFREGTSISKKSEKLRQEGVYKS